jgi:hypothetical protein
VKNCPSDPTDSRKLAFNGNFFTRCENCLHAMHNLYGIWMHFYQQSALLRIHFLQTFWHQGVKYVRNSFSKDSKDIFDKPLTFRQASYDKRKDIKEKY